MLSEATLRALSAPVHVIPLGEQMVKGRETPVTAYKITGLAAGAGGAAAGAAGRPTAPSGLLA